jgi:hypothetical protein
VTRVAAAIGIPRPAKFIAHRISKGYGWSYDQQTYEWMTANELRDYLRSQLDKWKEGAA